MIANFTFACPNKISFGAGARSKIPAHLAEFGKRVLLITGVNSFVTSNYFSNLTDSLKNESFEFFHARFTGEPSPDIVDEITTKYRDSRIDAVLAIGGGSVLDAGKAVAAMLQEDCSVMDFIEVVGAGKRHSGQTVSLIAVPTTSGTGTEATKNAVLSKIGPDGFKCSLRHDNFLPRVCVIDPELTLSCPSELTAGCGLDAFTQLLEAYVSTNANPMTDALAESGMAQMGNSLLAACNQGSNDIDVRSSMSYAAFLSGIVLANAGLGVVHGFAPVLGARYSIPHGVVCGTLIGEATKINIETLMQKYDHSHPALVKFARAGAILGGTTCQDVVDGCYLLIRIIEGWVNSLSLPKLAEYGVDESELDLLAEKTGLKNNPVDLDRQALRGILQNRL